MDLGFDTIGNATLVIYDDGPLLVTDPWLGGDAYFGSWRLSHVVPEEQLEAALRAKFVWFSHGHPDHLSGAWLKRFSSTRILLPDHVGARIRTDLEVAGHDVTVLPSATWVSLSDQVRVWCFPDRKQDAVLLVDIGGCLVVNINDATQTGWGPAVRREVRNFDRSVLLQLSGFGDADMINFYDESGVLLPPLPQLRKARGYKVGDALSKAADGFGIKYVVPFSSMHRYQREDSVWANDYVVAEQDFADGFRSARAELFPPFMRYSARTDDWEQLSVAAADPSVFSSSDFGDNWSDELSREELHEVATYFQRAETVASSLGFVRLLVGGVEHTVALQGSADRGVSFEVPRTSLLTAVRHEIFDDLLIGNFMKTTLHGRWRNTGLAAELHPLTRYSDNGRAYSADEVDRYLAEYQSRLITLDRLRFALEGGGARLIRSTFSVDSPAYRLARRTYWLGRRLASARQHN